MNAGGPSGPSGPSGSARYETSREGIDQRINITGADIEVGDKPDLARPERPDLHTVFRADRRQRIARWSVFIDCEEQQVGLRRGNRRDMGQVSKARRVVPASA